MLKKDKIVSCGAHTYANWVDKNFNTITLVTIIMLL